MMVYHPRFSGPVRALSFSAWIASAVKLNCSRRTLSSAHNEVFLTFGCSNGEGVYPVIRTSRPSASAVLTTFPTL